MKTETIGALYRNTDISEKELLLDILNNFGDSFNKEKSKNFHGSFHFLVLCEGTYEEFTIRVNDQQFQILQDYRDTHPYLNLQCSFETFCNITLGKFNPILDILNGKIQIDRNILSIGRFAKFGAIFSNRSIELTLPTSIPHSEDWKQPENILLVNGSPRKKGSTKLMLEWFKEGLPGGSIEVLDVSSLKMGRCLHCYKCWTDHPGRCVMEDDATGFREKMDAADLIVFFVPLSYSTMPSDMKRALERLFPETTPFFCQNKETGLTAHPIQKNKKSQAFLQFLVWGFPEMTHGRILEENFNEWAKHSHKNILGIIRRPGINMILGDPRLQPVRKKIRNATASLARAIYETGKIPTSEKHIIEKEDYVSKKDFHFYATNYWMQRFKTDYWN